MHLNLMDYEEQCFELDQAAPVNSQKIEYSDDGTALVLRLASMRTFGGVVRCWVNEEGKPMNTGSTTVPMRVNRPYRLAPMTAYSMKFHIALKEIPDNVTPQIIPTDELSAMGLFMTNTFVDGKTLQVTILPTRMLEIAEGYPVAKLVFIPRAPMMKNEKPVAMLTEKKAPVKTPKSHSNAEAKNGTRTRSQRA